MTSENETPPASNSSESSQAGLGKQLIDLQRDNSRLQQQVDSMGQTLETERSSKNELQAQVGTLQNQLTSKTAETKALQVLYTANVLPEYSQLLVPEALNVISQAGDKPAEEVAATLRSKYPAMFAAEGNPVGAGSTSSSTPASPPTSAAVSAGDNTAFLSNLEGIANGSVQLR
jgi:cell division septum initiation protein DivIVA